MGYKILFSYNGCTSRFNIDKAFKLEYNNLEDVLLDFEYYGKKTSRELTDELGLDKTVYAIAVYDDKGKTQYDFREIKYAY